MLSSRPCWTPSSIRKPADVRPSRPQTSCRSRSGDQLRAARTGRGSDELQEDHFCRIGLPGAQLENAGVAALALRVPRGDLLEQLVDHELVLAEAGHGQPAGMVIALLGEGDQPLQIGL